MVLKHSFGFLFEHLELDIVCEFFGLRACQVSLLIVPVQMVMHEKVSDIHVTCVVEPSLLCVDVLMDNFEDLLVQVPVLLRVVKQDIQQRALLIKFVLSIFVINDLLENLVKISRQQLLQILLGLIVHRILVMIIVKLFFLLTLGRFCE